MASFERNQLWHFELHVNKHLSLSLSNFQVAIISRDQKRKKNILCTKAMEVCFSLFSAQAGRKLVPRVTNCAIIISVCHECASVLV